MKTVKNIVLGLLVVSCGFMSNVSTMENNKEIIKSAGYDEAYDNYINNRIDSILNKNEEEVNNEEKINSDLLNEYSKFQNSIQQIQLVDNNENNEMEINFNLMNNKEINLNDSELKNNIEKLVVEKPVKVNKVRLFISKAKAVANKSFTKAREYFNKSNKKNIEDSEEKNNTGKRRLFAKVLANKNVQRVIKTTAGIGAAFLITPTVVGTLALNAKISTSILATTTAGAAVLGSITCGTFDKYLPKSDTSNDDSIIVEEKNNKENK